MKTMASGLFVFLKILQQALTKNATVKCIETCNNSVSVK